MVYKRFSRKRSCRPTENYSEISTTLSAFDGYCGFGHFNGFGDFGIIAPPVVFGFVPESALPLCGLSTEIPIEQRPCVESIPKAEYSFQT